MFPDPDRRGWFLAVVSRQWRDLIRGYSDDDLTMAREKIAHHAGRAGHIVFLSNREMNAIKRNPVLFPGPIAFARFDERPVRR